MIALSLSVGSGAADAHSFLVGSQRVAPALASTPPGVAVRGRVVDGRTGAPLEKVLIVLEDDQSVQTDPEGRFQFPSVTPGPHRLYVSVIGYALVRRDITAAADAAELAIALGEGTATYAESVTVTADPFRAPPEPVPSVQVLGAADLLNLRGVLADDPLRAVQALPGVATGDDLRSEFTVRGSDFRHITFTVDGFDTPYLLHSVRGVEDRGPTGSVAMINTDVLEDVTLLNGGYTQRYAGHTGAEVDFRLREGSRVGRKFHLAVSGTNASAVAEGPIGRNQRGSWLVSGRQSYLDLVVHRLTADGVSFGFSDVQAKAAYDLTPRQRVDATLLAGRSRFENDPDRDQIDDLAAGLNASVVGVAGWRWTVPRVLVSQRLLAAVNRFRNDNAANVPLDRGRDRQLSYRADASVTLGRTVQVESGGSLERLDDSRLRLRLAPNRVSLVQLDNYSGHALRAAAYSAVRWTPAPALAIASGIRGEHWSLAHQDVTSPWMQGEWRLRHGALVRGSGGVYQQVSEFDRVLGVSGGSDLRPERAAQFDVALEQRLGAHTRASMTLYDREDHDVLRRPGAETRLAGTRVIRGNAAAAYANRLDGFARGVELLLQRSATRGFTGWFSYAYAQNRYRDVVNGEVFWGDADQRHTLNAYAAYRRSDRASFVMKLRVGSNFPVPGYFAEQNGTYFVTDVRNRARLPTYARLDLRANRTFNWSRRRMTLFAEVINVLNRENVRFNPPGINTLTRQTGSPFDTMLPIVPSLGVLIEF